MNIKPLSDRIKKSRSLAGLTQAELADAAGITVRQVSRYETKNSEPRDRVLRALAEACKVSYEWLKNGGDEVELHDPATGKAGYLVSFSSEERRRIADMAEKLGLSVEDLISEMVVEGISRERPVVKSHTNGAEETLEERVRRLEQTLSEIKEKP
tara:strand:- start:1403 stop:1867 length:465 start_codon:yes stop_codon:yes gene_type:complete